jgi:pterin-4a-carbinolamine dehydratase
MKPERIGLTVLDLELYAWVVVLKTGMQAVQRTCAFFNFEYATDFAAEIGRIAEEHQLFPTLVISTPVAEAVPTLVEVTIAHPDLKPEHLALAKAIEVAYMAPVETTGAMETPAVDV